VGGARSPLFQIQRDPSVPRNRASWRLATYATSSEKAWMQRTVSQRALALPIMLFLFLLQALLAVCSLPVPMPMPLSLACPYPYRPAQMPARVSHLGVSATVVEVEFSQDSPI
jgi:hypothetical protein